MALNRRIFRMIKENLARYIGVTLLILLGSFTFIVAAGIAQNLDMLITSFAERNRQEDLSFTSSKPVAHIAGLERDLNLIMEESESFDAKLSETLTLRLLSATEKVNIPAPLEGRMLSDTGEILLEPAFAKANGYSTGSEIEIMGKTYTVAGFVSLPHYIYPLKNVFDVVVSPNNFGVGVISRGDFDNIEGAITHYAVRFNDRSESINSQAAALRQRLREEGIAESDWVDNMNNKRMRMPWASINGMKAMSVPLPAAMFLLCCLIVGIMIRRMIRGEAVIIGTLYAQGYRRRELMRHYMAIPLILSGVGGIIGTLVALPSIEPSVEALLSYYNVPLTGIRLSAANVLTGILMPMLFMGASSYFIVRSQLRQAPMELMKGDRQKTKVNALERAVRMDKFSFNTKFRLREQLRSPSRLLFLLLGVTGASVLMLLGFTVTNSMNYVFESSIAGTYRFAYEYSFREIQRGKAPEGAEVFSAGKFYPQRDERMEFYVTGVEPDSEMLVLKDSKGNPLSAGRTNITKPLADRLGVKSGDIVSVIGKQDGETYDFHIDAVADTYAGQFIFMPIAELNAKLGLPEDAYTGYWSDRTLDIPDERLSGVKSLEETSSAMNELMGPMLYSVVAMTAMACLVGLIIIFLVTSLIVEESRNTISLFKVFGYKRKEIHSLVLDSPVYAVIIGFLLGIPIMAISMGSLYGYLGAMINLVLPTIINPLHVLGCFAAILLTYQLSKRLCAKKVNAVSMNEALKAGTE